MDTLVYLGARLVATLIQLLPMTLVARIGRAGGGLVFLFDKKHREVAIKNMTRCFPERSPAEIRALARENIRRIGENYITAIKSSAMSLEQLQHHLTLTGAEHIAPPAPGERPRNIIMAIGHFGNFELYAHTCCFLEGYRLGTTYRGLRQPGLDRLMMSLRRTSSCTFFERRTQGTELKAFISQPGRMLCLLTDQRTIEGDLFLPFLGHDCSVNSAPAVFARRYRAGLHPVICYRTGLAQWRIEFGPEIPTRANGASRTTEAIMRDINTALEAAVRRDPANWFWVHDRWKMTKAQKRTQAATTAAENPAT